MRKRYYVVFVNRDEDGELRKIHIPMHYLYVFLAGALIGMLTITGMAGSYTRMLIKVTRFNQLRSEKDALKARYSKLEKVARETQIQNASLSSLAGEVSELYGLKAEPALPSRAAVEAATGENDGEFARASAAASLDRLEQLKTTAMSGAFTLQNGAHSGSSWWAMQRNFSPADWLRVASMPTLWPVEGRVTGSFGERIDPFNGEGAFHSGIDISCPYGRPVVAPADGVVAYADTMAGYGRLIIVEHARDLSTRYGHLSAFAVTEGQTVHRGDVLGYVGLSGRSTGPHLHYEVRIGETPVNPHRFLREVNEAGPVRTGD